MHESGSYQFDSISSMFTAWMELLVGTKEQVQDIEAINSIVSGGFQWLFEHGTKQVFDAGSIWRQPECLSGYFYPGDGISFLREKLRISAIPRSGHQNAPHLTRPENVFRIHGRGTWSAPPYASLVSESFVPIHLGSILRCIS